ncbi:MAG: alpha/beta fold hydrolase [Bacilli bacterium]
MDIKDINYIDYGVNKKGVIVLLHGWGQNIEMMDMIGHPFEKDFRIIVLDFPGFGKTPEPDSFWSTTDYAKCLHQFLTNLKVKNPILIGHSFGGRVAISYAAIYGAQKVVLLSAPFRPTKNKKPNLKVKIYKLVKKIPCFKKLTNYLRNKWGSSDYKNASEINRGSLVKIVNEDLTNYAKNIKCPTLLIYGELDKDVPLKEAQDLEKLIEDAGLIKYENAHHYAYLENLNQTIAILHNFLD